ncbi:hypothetical protein [Halorussus sp. MSC15.2]|uniref:hypothetical protein n=1 Tax=Halorussus sp. MSC15.2 TaxID=2283638 RepID=UPI0013D7AB91|nr:hypothetical protein [Halorussus sp. MSC15.2]NEU56483.1 hypothetical protein [Halorussus sp. MSC15.2]
MNRIEFFQVLTLWFVAATFLRSGSGNSNPALVVMAFVALGLIYGIPVYLLVELVDHIAE